MPPGRGAALQKLLEVSFDGLLAVEEGRVVAVNRVLAAFMGGEPQDLLGRPLGDLVRLEDEPPGAAPSPLSTQSTQSTPPTVPAAYPHPVPREGTATLLGGKEVPVEVLARPWTFEGRALELVALRELSLATTTQSALRRYQAELERRTEALTRANRVQREFLGVISHELRTPLTSVIGYAQVLGDEIVGSLNDRQREYAETIYAAGLQLTALINGLLDLSRLEAGEVALQRGAVPLTGLVQGGLRQVRAEAEAKGIALLAADHPEVALYGDPARLQQVLTYLLSNAVKFTPLGGTVRVNATAAADEVVLEVADDGIGISAADQAHLFTPFFLVDASSGRQQSGAGLGLALTKHLVALHGGRIWVASEPGRGSRFSVALPRFAAAQTGADAPSRSLPPN